MNAYSEADRTCMAPQIITILDQWQLNTDEIVTILDLPSKTRGRQIEHYRRGQALPDQQTVLTRAEHIAGIADALRTSFPRNPGIAARWLATPLRRFRSRTPLSLMLEEGINGLCRVRAELDCSFSWAHAQDPR